MSAVQEVLLAVPNISTSDVGRLQPLAAAALDVHTDADHGRSVVTYGGTGVAVGDACAALAKTASSLSLVEHVGVHPRFGVIDVLPLVPYLCDEQVALDVAADLQRYIEEDLRIPVYTYDRAHPNGRSLPVLRRFLRENSHPVHPTAGVVCLGVRDPLIAFNVNLRGPIGSARAIAGEVRSPDVRALGFDLRSRDLTQVSMNLVAPDRVGPSLAFESVATEARERGVKVIDCEIVGPVPESNLAELDGLPLIRPARSIEQALADKGVL